MVKTRSRGYFGVFIVVAAMVLLCVLAGSSGATVGDTTRVSVDSSGTQANGEGNGTPSISSDGRFVAFSSAATNLVDNDTNGHADVFVHDQTTGTTERVSVDSSGKQAYGGINAAISADGRYVAFVSYATGLVPGSDDTTTFEVFVRDRQEGTTERVSVDSSGTQPNGNSFRPSISSDGRYVAFRSGASDLVANDTNAAEDVFVRDRQEGTTERVSVDKDGNQANANSSVFSGSPSISSDGRFVAFDSNATNLVASDTNNSTDVFVRDRQEGTTERVSVDKDGNQAPAASWAPSISSDGRFVALTSNGLRPPGLWLEGGSDIFVRDRQMGTTQWVSRDLSQLSTNSDNFAPTISSDGRYVAFTSQASDLVANDTNGYDDIFVRDRSTGAIERVSVNGCGLQTNGKSIGSPSISSDGRYVAFYSEATNLVADDTNGARDYFVRDRTTPHTNECIAPTTTASATTGSGAEYISGTPTNRNVTVSLSAQDNEGGSGLRNIRYSATGADAISEQTVAAADLPAKFTIDAEGTTTVSYFATDNAGNQESPAKTLTVKIDKSAPSVSTWTPTGKDVARNTSVQAFFSERMNRDSISASAFKLFKCSSTTSTDCPTQITNLTLYKSPDGLSATLDPFGPTATLLAKSTKYKVVVTTGVTDEAGNRLDQNTTTTGNQSKAWYFTTGPT